MSGPDDAVTLSVPVMAVAGFLFTAAWGLVLWFLRRLVGQFDAALERVGKATSTLEAHTLEIAQLRAEHQRTREEVAHQRIVVEDLQGFLRELGFRKREGGAVT